MFRDAVNRRDEVHLIQLSGAVLEQGQDPISTFCGYDLTIDACVEAGCISSTIRPFSAGRRTRRRLAATLGP